MKKLFSRVLALALAVLMLLPVGAADAAPCGEDKVSLLLIVRDGVSLALRAAEAGLAVDEYALSAAGREAKKAADALLDCVRQTADDAAHCLEETARYTAALVALAVTADVSDIPYLRAAGDLAPVGEQFDVYTTARYAAAALDRTASSVKPDVIVNLTEEKITLDGAGTVIAVIDTGFDADMPAFTMPEGVDIPLAGDALRARLGLIGKKTADAGQDSRKIPFAYHYAEPGAALDTLAEHGTRTAALAGGYMGNTFDGAAPGAQLLLLKVFGETEQAAADERHILSAIEDALLLGADVINLSLASPAGGGGAGMGLTLAVEGAIGAGVGVVAPVGNNGELGQGSFFYTRSGSALFPAAHTDRGTVAHPASIAGVVSVGAAVGSYLSELALLDAAGNRILYTDTCREYFRSPDADADTDASDLARVLDFAALMGGGELAYTAIPGVGRAEDYADLDVRGRVALVERGEISFIEKTEHAAAAGAIGVIVYDNDPETDGRVNMQLDDALLPAIFINIADGQRLAEAKTGTLTFPDRDPANRGMSVWGVADFSSRGMRDDFGFAPTLVAPGEKFIGLSTDAKYALLEGTSYAAAQVSGALAALIGRLRETEAKKTAPEILEDAVTLLQNTASVLKIGNLPASLRAQGAGALNAVNVAESPLLLRGNDRGALTLTGEDSRFTLTFTAENRTGEPLTFTLHAPALLIDDTVDPLAGEDEEENESAKRWLALNGYTRENAPACVTGMQKQIPAEITLDGALLGEAGREITLAPGERRSISLAVTLDGEAYAAQSKCFPSGFSVEGMIAVEVGESSLSLPVAVFCGAWERAPITAGTAYDDAPDLYTYQILSAALRSGVTVNFGEQQGSDVLRNMAEFSPALACFNPHGLAEPLSLTLCLLRNVRSYTVSVINMDGEEVYRREGGALRKSYAYNGGAVAERIPLWGGRVTDNDKYLCPDGRYTIRLTLFGEAGGEETLEIPVTVDTTVPTLEDVRFVRDAEGNLRLSVTAADAEYIRKIEVGDRRGYLEYDRTVIESPQVLAGGRGASLSVSLDANALYQQYFYVTLTDYAYNETILRIDRDQLFAAHEASEAGR